MAAIREQIFKRSERGTYRARIQFPGEDWIQKDHPNKRAAVDWVEDLKADYHKGRYVGRNADITLAEFFEDTFLPTIADPDKRARFKSLGRCHLLPSVGKITLADIDRAWIRRWFSKLPELRTRGGKPASLSLQRQVFFLFKQTIDRAVDDEILLRSPLPSDVRPDQPQPTKIENTLSPGQIERLANAFMATCSERGRGQPDRALWGFLNYVFVYVLAYGGFRLGEGLALRVSDVGVRPDGTGFITVDEQIRGQEVRSRLKRRRSHRTVPVGREIVGLLADLCDRAERTGQDFIFANPATGKPIDAHNWRDRLWNKIVAEAGLPDSLTPHDLRHTAASAWFDEGWDMEMVASFLGDSVEVARDIYVHMYESRRSAGIDRMDARLQRGREEATRTLGNVVPLRGRGRTG